MLCSVKPAVFMCSISFPSWFPLKEEPKAVLRLFSHLLGSFSPNQWMSHLHFPFDSIWFHTGKTSGEPKCINKSHVGTVICSLFRNQVGLAQQSVDRESGGKSMFVWLESYPKLTTEVLFVSNFSHYLGHMSGQNMQTNQHFWTHIKATYFFTAPGQPSLHVCVTTNCQLFVYEVILSPRCTGQTTMVLVYLKELLFFLQLGADQGRITFIPQTNHTRVRRKPDKDDHFKLEPVLRSKLSMPWISFLLPSFTKPNKRDPAKQSHESGH